MGGGLWGRDRERTDQDPVGAGDWGKAVCNSIAPGALKDSLKNGRILDWLTQDKPDHSKQLG